jgi:hypothetical protein
LMSDPPAARHIKIVYTHRPAASASRPTRTSSTTSSGGSNASGSTSRSDPATPEAPPGPTPAGCRSYPLLEGPNHDPVPHRCQADRDTSCGR